MERIPVWVIDDRSGSAGETEPDAWTCEDDGDSGKLWSRGGLMSFGRANAMYRRRHFCCPECDSMLRPMRRRAYFACAGCLLAYKWRNGVLSGYGREASAAMHVSPQEFNFR